MSASINSGFAPNNNWLRPMRAPVGSPGFEPGFNERVSSNIFFPSANWVPTQLPTASLDGWIDNIGPGPRGVVLPDPPTDVMAIISGGFNGVHQWFTTFNGAPNTTYTLSVYARAAGYNFLAFSLGNAGFDPNSQTVVFDLGTGTIQQQTPNGSGTIKSAGGGWYRCTVTATSNSSTGGPYVAVHNASPLGGNTIIFQGDMVSGMWLWGLQVEIGTTATSLIQTTTAPVTRDAWLMRPPDLGAAPRVATLTGFGTGGGAGIGANSDAAWGIVQCFPGIGAISAGALILNYPTIPPNMTYLCDWATLGVTGQGTTQHIIAWSTPGLVNLIPNSKPLLIAYERTVSQ